MNIGNASTLNELSSDEFKKLFDTIQKKYATMNKQLLKYCESSLHSISLTVSEFTRGDYYQMDIDSAERILDIAERNFEIISKSL